MKSHSVIVVLLFAHISAALRLTMSASTRNLLLPVEGGNICYDLVPSNTASPPIVYLPSLTRPKNEAKASNLQAWCRKNGQSEDLTPAAHAVTPIYYHRAHVPLRGLLRGRSVIGQVCRWISRSVGGGLDLSHRRGSEARAGPVTGTSFTCRTRRGRLDQLRDRHEET
jgi:hypothetical protein